MKNYITRIGRMDKKIRWLFLFAVLSFICFMSILYQQKRSQEKTRQSIYTSYSTINKIEKINTLIVETESAMRSFLITKDNSWKQELDSVQNRLLDSINALRSLPDTIAIQQQVDTLMALTLQKIAIQDSIVNAKVLPDALFQRIRARGDARPIKYALTTLLARTMLAEEQLLIQKTASNENDYRIGLWITLGGGIFAFILVFSVLYRLNSDIRLRRSTEEKLIDSEGKYRNLIENAGVVVFTTNLEGKVTFTNKQASQLTGYSMKELVGHHYSMLIDPEWVAYVQGFYAEQFMSRVPSTTLQFLTHSRDGRDIWVEQFAQLLFENDNITGFQCMVRDITEKKKIELALNKSELRLQSILDNTTALIFIKDLEGRYIMVNRRFKEMLGLTEDEVIGKTDYDINPGEKADYYHETDTQLLQTLGTIKYEEVIESYEGSRTLLVIKFPLLDDREQPFGISGIATDITELVHNRIELESALKNVKEAKELQEQFLANMSHEIRTPLNGIQGMSGLLLETTLTEDQRDFVMMIKHSLNNLTAIVNDVLDISNLRAGKLMLENIAFNINDPIDAIKIQYTNQVNRKKIAFDVIIEDDVPKLIIGDPYRLRQVLVSLVDNAVKFTESGNVSLCVSLEKQTAFIAVIQFTIEDSGMGIPSDKLTTIFQSFAQADMKISRSFGGAGLGLAISKGLVEMQGGNISVQSVPDKGSVFSFSIPYEIPQNIGEPSDSGTFAAVLRGKHFLVVEDNPVNQQLIDSVLQKTGAIVEMASDGRQAIAYLEKGNKYDLVIMDLQMPVMDGYETAACIRKQLKMTIPILALTATALRGDQEKCKELEIDDFMLKPFDFNDLYRRLADLLQNKKPAKTGLMGKATNNTPGKKLYDLATLKSMGDKESLLDIISLILSNTFSDIQQLPILAREKNWPKLFKAAHKAKGSVSVLQATSILQLLAEIEKNAREETHLSAIEEKVTAVMKLFAEMELQLRDEEKQLREEIAAE